MPNDDIWDSLLSEPDPKTIDTPIENSSIIRRVIYSPKFLALTIHFKAANETYTYFDVPGHIYKEMMAADSIGKYFAANIKKKYTFSKKAQKKAAHNENPSNEK